MSNPNNMVPFPGAPPATNSLADMASAKNSPAPPLPQQPAPGFPAGVQQQPMVVQPMMAQTPQAAPQVPQTAVLLATAHSYAQRVPWFVWLGVGAGFAYWYTSRSK